MTSLFETFLRISGYNLQAARKRLRSIQQMDVDAFKLWQSDSKWKIARFHYENNEVYKRKVGPKFPDRWEDLPIMQKTDFQEDMDKLLSRGYSQRTTYTANTSGSSGHPFYFAKDKAAHALDWALIQDRYQQHGLSLSSRQVRFYGIPLERISFWTE